MYPKRRGGNPDFQIALPALLRSARYVCSLWHVHAGHVCFMIGTSSGGWLLANLIGISPLPGSPPAAYGSIMIPYACPRRLGSNPTFAVISILARFPFRRDHGVPTAVARPVTVGIGNVPDEWVFSCLWHPPCRQAGLRKVLSISFSRARSSPFRVSDSFSSNSHCSSVRYFMPRR